MNLLRLYAVTLALLVLTSCYVLPAPDMLRDEYATGAMVGCMRTMVVISQHKLKPAEQKSVLDFCALMARDSLRLYDEDKAKPTPEPGSTL